MDQHIGSKTPPVPAAGLDPAYIPGLVPPRTESAPESSTDTDDVATEQADGTAPVDAAAAEEPADATPQPDSADDEDAPARDDRDDRDDEGAEDDDGPVFEVSDRRGAIVADRTGVTFRLDEEVAEFGWDEIGAVEIDTPRFGRRFGVTVYISDRRWFRTDVEAPSRAVLQEWAAELDAVLDARFEEADA
ncbi:hypothetical protein [Streptomyces sp. FIT100]|uniref:hypothetical protein n=1 Tax=Streptomyces sp. FIT100 TaxID=2837956 RepID=UPI0021C605C5|nr:hypothetical protein [Streptomyces sp. FIT100]UUN30758.1 hypothetical protein KK483_33795 [Streptomyces sp. FIT100]